MSVKSLLLQQEPKRFANLLEQKMLNTIEMQNAQIKQLNHQAQKDALTRLNNFGYWKESMEILQYQDNVAIMLVSLDVNLLKPTNDVFGHDSGDIALISTSAILKTAFRDDDIIVRKGGDEFAIAMKFDIDELKREYQDFLANNYLPIPPTIEQYFEAKICERIKDHIEGHNDHLQPSSIPLSIAYGAALSFPKADITPPHHLEDTFQQADERMYHMKQALKSKSIADFLLK